MDQQNKAEMVTLLAPRYEVWVEDQETARRAARLVVAVLDMLFVETTAADEFANQVFVEETGRLLYAYLLSYLVS